MDRDRLGDAVGRAADGAGDVRAVSVAVVDAAADEVGAEADATGELVVGDVETGVDHVGVHAGTGGVVGVPGVERQQAAIDAIQAPGRAGLDGAGHGDAVLLHVGHARIGEQPGERLVVGPDHEAAQHAVVGADEAGAMLHGDRFRGHRHATDAAGFADQARGLRLEYHDVLALDRFRGRAELACEGGRGSAQQRGADSEGEMMHLEFHRTFLVHGVSHDAD